MGPASPHGSFYGSSVCAAPQRAPTPALSFPHDPSLRNCADMSQPPWLLSLTVPWCTTGVGGSLGWQGRVQPTAPAREWGTPGLSTSLGTGGGQASSSVCLARQGPYFSTLASLCQCCHPNSIHCDHYHPGLNAAAEADSCPEQPPFTLAVEGSAQGGDHCKGP